ncbi:MAG: hypothetical protein JXR49_20700 [Acidobacteria bacterium]|nr:hypothetical protein [Acidobacteriota bacterium]
MITADNSSISIPVATCIRFSILNDGSKENSKL